jgi:hypothetical protein
VKTEWGVSGREGERDRENELIFLKQYLIKFATVCALMTAKLFAG